MQLPQYLVGQKVLHKSKEHLVIFTSEDYLTLFDVVENKILDVDVSVDQVKICTLQSDTVLSLQKALTIRDMLSNEVDSNLNMAYTTLASTIYIND